MEMSDRDFDRLVESYQDKIDRRQDKLDAANRRVQELEDAIRKHRDAKGHDRCWENDKELYRALPETPPNEPNLPPTKEEMLAQCAVYVDGQFAGLKPPFQLHKDETGARRLYG